MYKDGCDVKSRKEMFVLPLCVLHTPCNVLLVQLITVVAHVATKWINILVHKNYQHKTS
jgi:hypothetical protein